MQSETQPPHARIPAHGLLSDPQSGQHICHDRRERFRIGELDTSGLLLGAYATGMLYQPNLVSCSTCDQAIIAGVAAMPTPGIFDEGGYDYRREIPEAIRTVWGLDVSDEQMERVQQALRERELVWAVKRSWKTAELKPTPERPAAEQALAAKASVWTGRTIDVDGLRAIAAGEVLQTGEDLPHAPRPESA